MGTHDVDDYIFTALDDFSRLSDLDSKLNSAKEFGIRIVECKGIQWNDWRVKKDHCYDSAAGQAICYSAMIAKTDSSFEKWRLTEIRISVFIIMK